MKSKVLITGASGFIGSFLAEEALRQEYEVYAGIRPTSSREHLKDPRIRFVELDFSSKATLERQLSAAGFDYVVHNAGITYAHRKEDFEKVNSVYTKNLAEALQATGHPLKKFVLISSLAAYGPGNPATFQPVRSADARKPISSYGKSKLKAEEHLQSMSGFPYLILNPTAVYGPRDKDFFEFVKLVSRGFEPYIGTHRQMISLVYVEDLARAVIRAMGSAAINRSFIISDRSAYDKEKLGEVIRTTLGRKTFKIKLPAAPLRAVIAGVEGIYSLFGKQPFLNTDKVNEISAPNWLCDSDEFWNAMGAVPEYNLERGIRATVAWYKEKGWL